MMKKYLTFLLLIITTVFAFGQRNLNVTKIGQNTYQVSINMNTFRFQKVMSGSRGSFATYAACIQMILDYNGLNVTQDQVASTFPETTTSGGDIMINVNSLRTAAWGRSVHVSCDIITINEDNIFDELLANRPIVVSRSIGEVDKASLLTAMTYNIIFDASGNQTGITPLTVTLRDPDLTSASTKAINWPDFSASGSTLYSVKIPEK